MCQNIENENNEKNIVIDLEIEQLIEKRNNYRKNKEFNKADEIRDQLLKKGIEIVDNGFSSTWKKA